MAPARTVSIIIPTYNRCDVVERTLRQLQDQDYADDLYEIIVVDNSSDGTPAMVRRVAETSSVSMTLIDDSKPLPAIKRNVGVETATGDLCWFINDDVWFHPRAMQEHVDSHNAHEAPVAVLGHCRQSPEMDQTPFVAAYQPFAYDHMTEFIDKPVPYGFFWSMNLTLPRQTMLDRNLLFHEDWRHIGHEDVELGYRWTSAGYDAIYNPRSTGDHFHPHTVTSASRLQFSIGRGLRDLESLIDDDELLERYGVMHRNASPRSLVRGAVRHALFNRVTVKPATTWLDSRRDRSAVADWMYWKVLLHHTNRGYQDESPRDVTPRPTTVGVT